MILVTGATAVILVASVAMAPTLPTPSKTSKGV